jgi:hypothetical protein
LGPSHGTCCGFPTPRIACASPGQAHGHPVLMEVAHWPARRAWLTKPRTDALLAAARAGGRPLAGLGVIGSFTYNRFGWADLDLVMLISDDAPVLHVVHDVALQGCDGAPVDLITLSTGALRSPETFGDARLPEIADSRGRPYEALCLLKSCMAQSLRFVLGYAHWLAPPDASVELEPRFSAPSAQAVTGRLLAEASCYLADRDDFLKGVRRLAMAARIVDAFGLTPRGLAERMDQAQASAESGSRAPRVREAIAEALLVVRGVDLSRARVCLATCGPE